MGVIVASDDDVMRPFAVGQPLALTLDGSLRTPFELKTLPTEALWSGAASAPSRELKSVEELAGLVQGEELR